MPNLPDTTNTNSLQSNSSHSIPPFIDQKSIFTVNELNNAINLELQQTFGTVYVEGEISNLAKPASGHYYFTLKDQLSQVKCALFKGYRKFVKTKIDNGQKILVKAKISIYAPRGDYQLIVEHAYPTGLGALQQAYEALKKKLHAEGLFDSKHKKPLPILPKQIYVITSPTGAAIRDILITLNRRFSSIPVRIIPTLVQGELAPKQIIKAIKAADKLADSQSDVIILARGGGSLEDLWAFNDEELARAIHKSKTPIIAGIGHEVDFTIADFVADLRAATPTAAAESATPNWRDYSYKISNLEQMLHKNFKLIIHRLYSILKDKQHRLLQQHPETKLQNQIQLLDELDLRLQYSWERLSNTYKNKIRLLNHRLNQQCPINNINLYTNNLKHYQKILIQNILKLIDSNNNLLKQNIIKLNSVNPLEVLSRGYSILKTSSGEVITSNEQVKTGDKLSAQLAKGKIECEVL